MGLEREQSLNNKKYIDHMYVIMPFEKNFTRKNMIMKYNIMDTH